MKGTKEDRPMIYAWNVIDCNSGGHERVWAVEWNDGGGKVRMDEGNLRIRIANLKDQGMPFEEEDAALMALRHHCKLA